MSLISEETLAKFPVNNDLMKIFSDKAIADMPDLARSYLFQLIYTNGTVEYYDLMLKTRKVDFDEDGKGIIVQFDEFQDFRVWSILNELVRNKDILNIKMNFYDKPFLMPIEDVFTITGRGTVVTGRVERGQVKVGDQVEIIGIKETQTSVVTGVEMFRKLLDYAEAGDNIGVLLRGVNRDQVQRGQVLAKPKSVTPHTKFTAQVYVLSKEEGGRHTPFFSNYRPQFYFRTTDVTGIIQLQAGVEMVMPGDNTVMNVELIHPIAMEQGTKFSIREGGRTVGAGSVVEIIE